MSKAPACDPTEVAAWFAKNLPENWFTGPASLQIDKDEILVVGPIEAPVSREPMAVQSAIIEFRRATKAERITIAEVAQSLWRRKVSWGVSSGEIEARFTTASVPVMTRLRLEERAVLDTLIDAGVARSRSDALAWCVNQVGQHQGEWIARLQGAMSEVERIRREGPGEGSVR